jgi:ankyrin repeat protein
MGLNFTSTLIGEFTMKIVRHFFILVCLIFCLLLLSLDTAYAQSIPPRAYLFVEVNDTGGKAVEDVTVAVSNPDGKEILREKTNKDGVGLGNFLMWSRAHHYNLQITKPGYLPYEQVFFLYPSGVSESFTSRVEEISNGKEDLKNSQSSPVKIMLLKIPATPSERLAVEAQEQKRQLLLAAKRGDPVGLRKLLEAGVKANIVDTRGVPVIAWAALSGDTETIKALLAAGAEVRNKNKPGHQALLIYLSEGIFRESQIVKSENGTSIVPRETLIERHEEIVRKLIEAGAGVNVQIPYRGTVLNRAIGLIPYSLSIEIIKALLAAGANVNAADAFGQTPLMIASQGGSKEVIKLLLDAGARASINAKDVKGHTALMFAPMRYDSEPEIVRVLIAAGADVNAVNEDGQTALMLAAQGGSIEIIQLLLKSGVSISTKDNKGQTALMYSSQPSSYRQPFNADVSKILIQAGASVNEKDAQGLTALMYSSKVFTAQSADVSKVLIQAGASLNEKDAKGWTALMYASPRYYNDSASEVVKVLIAAGADVNTLNEDGQSALMLAARWYDEETVIMLIAAGASINIKDKKGQTPLMQACQTTSPINVELFIKAGADASVNAKDARGWTALMYAVPRAYASTDAKALIAAGANVNDANEDGQTALMLAAQTGSIEIIKTLLDAGAVASINTKDKQGRIALTYVKPKYTHDSVSEVVKALIAAGANINAADEGGQTPLMLTALDMAWHSEELIKLLLEAGASINAKDKQGKTALMVAIGNESMNVDKVKLLLASGADVSIKDTQGQTALMIARQIRNETIIKLLEEAGPRH